MATVLAQLCCFKNELPQRAPTSPIIANMICAKLDSRLQRLAERFRCTYTRYADDISISTSTARFPGRLARARRTPTGITVELGSLLVRVIEENGFAVNTAKVRLQSQHRRQEVTGLTVNRFPNPRRRVYSQVRSMLHAWETYGYPEAEREFWSRYHRQHRKPDGRAPSFRKVVAGKLEFIRMIRGSQSLAYQRLYARYLALCGRSPHDAVYVLECAQTGIQGTAFFLRGYGLITCAHVLGPKTLAFSANAFTKSLSLRVLYRNDYLDVAILAFDEHQSHALQSADPQKVEIGDIATLLGFPNYNPGQSIYVYPASISGTVTRFGTRRFTINAPIIQGNSGGPLLNAQGHVIGIAVTGLDMPKPTSPTEYGVIWIDTLKVVKGSLLEQLAGLLRILQETRATELDA